MAKRNPITDLVSQHWKTKAFLVSAELHALGWSAADLNPEFLIGPVVSLYVWDQPTQWVWACTVPADAFVEISSAAHRAPSLWDAYRHGLGHAILDALASTSSSDWKVTLAIALCAYAGTTQTWALSDRLQHGGHLAVLQYRRNADVRDTYLRPFVPPHCPDQLNRLLPAPAFLRTINQVLSIDQARHPEWF
jgi:hypothetical protein